MLVWDADIARYRSRALTVPDDLFYIGGEVRIENGRFSGFFFVSFRQCDALRDQTAAHRFGEYLPSAHNDNRFAPLDDDLSPRTRARTPAKSLAASASKMWMMFFAIDGIIPYSSSASSGVQRA